MGSVLFSLAFTHSPPFKTLYEWGNQLRANQATAAGSQFSYVRKEFIRADAKGDKLVIDLRKGAYFTILNTRFGLKPWTVLLFSHFM